MKYFVTGGAGFIGSNLVEHLIREGHQVITIDNLSTGDILNLSPVSSSRNHRFFFGDVQTFDWDKHLSKGDIIIHLAATVGVDYVIKDALETANNNFSSTELILTKAQQYQAKLIFASTSEVYGIHQRCECNENDDLHINILREGRSGYTLAKLYGEFLCLSYYNQFNTDVCVFRFFNTIGKNQHYKFGMVVPTFINQAIQGLPLTVYGNGQQTRSFCDVRDLIQGIYMASLSNKVSGKIYNLGNNQPISILELAQYIIRQLNSESEILFAEPPRQRDNTIDVRHRQPDLTAIMRDINWKPEISWQQSVNDLSRTFMAEKVA